MQGYLFSTTPVHLQGRVNSLAGVIELAITAFVPAIASTLVAAHFSTFSFALGSIAAAIAVIGLLSNRGLRNLGRPSEWHTTVTNPPELNSTDGTTLNDKSYDTSDELTDNQN